MYHIYAKILQVFLVLVIVFYNVDAQQQIAVSQPNVHAVPRQFGFGGINAGLGGCPLCDSSVYSYCSFKLVHDSCCCGDPFLQSYQCQFSDCTFLHANSCQEHRLIAGCCCENYGKK